MIEYRSNYYNWRTLKTYNASILQRFEEMEYFIKLNGIEMNAVNNGLLNPLLVVDDGHLNMLQVHQV